MSGERDVIGSVPGLRRPAGRFDTPRLYQPGVT